MNKRQAKKINTRFLNGGYDGYSRLQKDTAHKICYHALAKSYGHKGNFNPPVPDKEVILNILNRPQGIYRLIG